MSKNILKLDSFNIVSNLRLLPLAVSLSLTLCIFVCRVGATLGLATGYVLQKQVARARNVLKRVAKAPWTVEEAESLERCWLLLADLHVQAGKHDPAVELLRRTLAHNQSSHRAHQLLALIAEKEQKYCELTDILYSTSVVLKSFN